MSILTNVMLTVGFIVILLVTIVIVIMAGLITSNPLDHAIVTAAMFIPMGLMFIALVVAIVFDDVVKAIKERD